MSYSKKHITKKPKPIRKKHSGKKRQQSFTSKGQPESVNKSGIKVENNSLWMRFILAFLGILLGGWLIAKGMTDDHLSINWDSLSINSSYVGIPVVLVSLIAAFHIYPKIEISN